MIEFHLPFTLRLDHACEYKELLVQNYKLREMAQGEVKSFIRSLATPRASRFVLS